MDIRLIQVPYDSGRRGERMGRGPLHFIDQKAPELLEAQHWNVNLETVASHQPFQTEIFTAFELSQKIAEQVQKARDEGALPLVLAGNCISCLGTITGSDPSRLGVIWFDAHGDLNTPDTTLGFLDGMALATAVGRCWPSMTAKIPGFIPIPEAQVLMIGTRQLDPPEETYLTTSPIQMVGGEAIRENGVPISLAAPLAHLRSRVERVYIHIDLDVVDLEVGQANVYAEPNGLRVHELESALALINQQFEIVSLAFTAYDPEVDVNQHVFQAALRLMITLIKRIENKIL